MKIAFVITGLIYGGAENVTVNLAVELRKRGFEVIVISIMTPKAYLDFLEANGVKLYTLGADKKTDFIFSALKLLKILKREKPDVVHAHMYHANIFSRIASLFSSAKYLLVNTIHNTYEGGGLRKFTNKLTRGIPGFTSQVSRLGYENYLRDGLITEKTAGYVGNSVNVQAFASAEPFDFTTIEGIADDTFVFLTVGRLERQKDYPNLFKAVDATRKRTEKPFVLCVVGAGALETELQQLSETMGLNKYIKFLGIRKDIPMLMRGADCFVMGSEWEGAPISLLEAMSSGLPVVVTDAGDNRFIVQQGDSGFIALIKDADQLAAYLMQILTMDAGHLQQMGARSYEIAQNGFDHAVIIDTWIDIYKNKGAGNDTV